MTPGTRITCRKPSTEMEPEWLNWSKRLQAIASTGAHYATDAFDRERYQEVADIAMAMLTSLASSEPSVIAGFDADYGSGYATPKVEVRAAVFRDDQILLVREKSDGLWTLPGGFADVGLSPAQNVVKEVREEAALAVVPRGLFKVCHKARHAYDPDVRDFYKLFFLCESMNEAEPEPGLETSETAYFGLAALPALSRGRVIEADITDAYAYRQNPSRGCVFD